jgi:hypothetical protein
MADASSIPAEPATVLASTPISTSNPASAALLTSPSILGKRSSQDRDPAELMDLDNSASSSVLPSIAFTSEKNVTSGLESDHSTIPSPPTSPISSNTQHQLSSPSTSSRKALRQDSNASASRSLRATSVAPEEGLSSAQAPRIDDDEAQIEAQVSTEPSTRSSMLFDEAMPPLSAPPARVPPPLPPRRAASSLTSDGPMMFGKLAGTLSPFCPFEFSS